MTAQWFLSLKDQRRENVLTLKGVLLAHRVKDGLVYDVYQVDSFFVEFCYQISANSTVTTRVFTDMESLDPYFEDLDVLELIKETTGNVQQPPVQLQAV